MGVETIGLIGALAAAASAGTGIASAAGAFGKPSGGGAVPHAPTVDPTSMAKGLLPGTAANAAATTGGGASPQYLAQMVGQQTGDPGSGLGILDDIRKSLGQGGM